MYSKPEITKLASSINAIQSQGMKVQIFLLESPSCMRGMTPLAYEADE